MNAVQASPELKAAARAEFAAAVRNGVIRKPARCERCSAAAEEAHHADYTKPLAVEWLCVPCHAKEHSDDAPSVGHSIFCERLFHARLDVGLTRAGLAKRMNCRVATVHEWERGIMDPRASSVVALCRALGVSADWLLGIDAAVASASVAA